MQNQRIAGRGWRNRIHHAVRLACLAVGLVGASIHLAHAEVVLEIGDQKGNARAVLEASGQLKDVPYVIHWHEFPNAAPLLEALSANQLDAGTIGDAPLTYASQRPGFNIRGIFATRYYGNALVVSSQEKATTLAALKGKRIATVFGSSGHAMALAALQEAHLPFNTVQFVNLAPGDASTALTGGSIAGLASWEPYVSFAVQQSGARIVADGKDYPSLSYFAATTGAIANKRAALADIVNRIAAARRWGAANQDAYAAIISKIVGIPKAVALGQVQRERNTPSAITAEIVAQQQKTIDLYVAAGLIKQRVDAHTLLDTSFAVADPAKGK